MRVFAGIDLGTSGIKIALVDEAGRVLASLSQPVEVERPHPGWSQQDPVLWWTTACAIFDALRAEHPDLMQRLAGMSLSGQMLGSVLLDADNRPTYPCILWNDQRALAECRDLLARVPDIGQRTNGHPDPGLTAPKLLWLRKHAPGALDRADILMLPKDYVRLCLTGERLSEPSDASGTMMMDCASRSWDAELVTAAGWDMARLPGLVASTETAGRLRPALLKRWGISGPVDVAAGAGDNFACTLGVGGARPGQSVVTIGTSGVLCAVDGTFHPAPDKAVLTAPHAVPDTYLSMGVVMSATQSLDWLAGLCQRPVTDLVEAAEARVRETGFAHLPIIRPSLTGVRTPDNRPDAGASLRGLSATSDAVDLAYGIMEGIAFQFYDCFQAQRAAGVPIDTIGAVGGGSQSRFWVQLIATLFGAQIGLPVGGEVAGCLGAARLARASHDPASASQILFEQARSQGIVEPEQGWREGLLERHRAFRELTF